ncbi:hypothetical protein LPJ57_011189, partial [Coemansia sp. RSA 486]
NRISMEAPIADVPPPLPPKDHIPVALPPKDNIPVAPLPVVQSTAAYAMPVLPPHPPATQEHALVLYDFTTDDPEELAVSEGERVLVLDKSDTEWWQVQISPPHGRAGLVPASYLELHAGAVDDHEQQSVTTAPSVRSLHIHAPQPVPPPSSISRDPEMPPLPVRSDTVRKAAATQAHQAMQQQQQQPLSVVIDKNLQNTGGMQKTADSDNVPLQMLQMRPTSNNVPPVPTGPDMAKVRTWTDGSGAYTVEAQFIDLDPKGNVHLHKTNGKTIIVPLAKFSAEDKRYVDNLQGKAPEMPAKSKTARQRQQENAKKNPAKRIINYDWDWFDFFTLEAGISADNALKYATSF